MVDRKMSGVTIYEFGVLVRQGTDDSKTDELRKVPAKVFDWLEKQLRRKGIGYTKDGNCFPWIEDVEAAQAEGVK